MITRQTLTLLIFILPAALCEAQITGPNPTSAGSTQTYNWSGVGINTPVWQVSNGTKGASSSSQVTVTWNTNATSGAIVLLDGGTFRGSLSVNLVPAVPTASAATLITTNSFTANWSSSPTATSYRLDVSTSSSFSTFLTGYNNLTVASTTQSITGLNAGTTYYYRARAVNSNGASTNSTTITALTIPAAPVASAQTSGTTTSFMANWGAVSSAASYRLDVSTVSNFATFVSGYNNISVFTTSKSVTGLTIGTAYYYRVRAVNASGTSVDSNVINAPTVSGAPAGLVANSITSGSFTANWNVVTTSTSYRLDVSTSATFTSFVSGFNSLLVSGTTQNVTGLSSNTLYYFRVRATNSSGTSVSSTNGSATTLIGEPTVLASTGVSTNSFTANWSVGSGATSYKLRVSQTSDFSSFVSGFNDLPVVGTSQNVTGLTPGTLYYIRVKGVNGALNSVYSGTGTTPTITTSPAATAPTTVTETTFIANWGAVSGATSYQLDVSTFANFSPMLGGYNSLPVGGTSQAVSGLEGGKTYYYRVRGVNSSGASASGTNGSALTIPAPPTGLNGNLVEAFSFVANWSTLGATSYMVDVAYDAAFTNMLPGFSNYSLTAQNLTITGLTPSTPYYFRVKATNSSGTSGYSSQTVTTRERFKNQNQNFIVSSTVLADNIYPGTALDGLPRESVSQTVQYFDGLGRPSQTVSVQASVLKKDIIQPVAYDENGRERFNYLPFVPGQSTGWYKETPVKTPANYTTSDHFAFYQNGSTDKIGDDTRPFSENVFEASPLNRVTKTFGPGNEWYVNNKATEFQVGVNKDGTGSDQEKVIFWEIVSEMPVRKTAFKSGYYTSGYLMISISIDEQGNPVRSYTDQDGRVILKKVYFSGSKTDLNNPLNWAQTYYIYDEVGNLRFVLPPELSKLIHQNDAGNYNPSGTDLTNWAFQYKYDVRKRMIEKQVPGSGAVYMIYDKRDRLVLTQDANQRSTNKWVYTKYDVLNRPTMTGIYTHGSALTQSQMTAQISTSVFYETYNGNSSTHGYTSTAAYFPNTSLQLLTATYYDNYSFKSMTSGLDYVNSDLSGQVSAEFTRVIGKPTGAKVNILGSSNYLYSVTYYDDQYRVLQTIAQNHKSGSDRATSKYDFVGKPLETKRTYVVSAVSRTVKETFAYDHAGRILNVKHAANGAADIMIVKNEYNELGQLVDKQLHSTDNGTTFKQSVDHCCNIRGWLTKINESDISTLASGETLGDYFGMELAYNNALANLTATPAFNGNISAIKWSTGAVGAANLQGNAYDYDPLNRLSGSSHYKDGLTGWTNDNSNLETGFSYDLNGNIQGLTRKGDLAATIDNLTYNYTGNKLNYVNDASDATKGFVNGNTGTDDYAYDVNGNLTKDKNKGINNNNDIKYNYLNLPTEVIKGADKVKYYYDATGRKLYQELYTGAAVTKTTDYVGELIFENNTLQFINHSEGRVLSDGANWEYQYHLKDHLGNVRLTFTAKTPTAIIHTATFETGTQTAEQNTFGSSYSSIGYDLVDKTDAGTTYQKVQYLNGGVSGRVGLAKSYSVVPGDKIKAEVYAKYRNPGSSPNTTPFITALATAFGTYSGATGELGKMYTGLNSYAGTVGNGEHPLDDDGAPKAFVTIILFDKNYNLVDAAWDQVDVSANQVSPTVKTPPVHDYMLKEVTVSEPGYAYVFLSNEHPYFVDIYYDDYKITHTPSPVVGVNDYYPFGLTFNSYSRENSVANQYLYNGKEKQDELDLGWLDFGARMHMSDIGRWGAIDPHADNYLNISPYSFCVNNPINFIDPDGKDIIFEITRNKKTNEITGVKIRSTITITGDGANQDRADKLNEAAGGVFKSRTLENGVKVSFDIKYQYKKNFQVGDLKPGDNLLNYVSKVSNENTEPRQVSNVPAQIASINPYVETSGKYGEIFKDDWDDTNAVFHESLHFTGLIDQYGPAGPMYGFSNDIMGKRDSPNIGYDHYNNYYQRANHPYHTKKFPKGFVNKTKMGYDSKGGSIAPSKKQIDEQEY